MLEADRLSVVQSGIFSNAHGPMQIQLDIQDVHLSHPQGELYTKYWYNPASEFAPLILFHESLGSVQQWKQFPEQLAYATGRSIIAYDRIGFGQSTGQTGLVQPDFVRLEARQTLPILRQHFNITEFVTFGHSIGGGYAAGCALEYPEDCQALIIESILAHADEHMRAGIRQAQVAFQNPNWMQRLALYHADKAESVLNAWINSWLSPRFEHWSIEHEIAQLSCPTIIIHPENDEYGRVDQAERIVKALKARNELHLIAQCGHVPHHEYPELIVNKIATFLEHIA